MTALVMLHGWGMTPRVFETLGDRLRAGYDIHALAIPGYDGVPACEPYTLDVLARRMAAAAPKRCVLVGWSLGALIALAWARGHAHQVQAVVLIGATPSFVQRADWTSAVEHRVFQDFRAGMRDDRHGTLTRFALLCARGDPAAKNAARVLRACGASESQASTTALEAGLDVLVDTDLRSMLAHVEQRALVVHGSCDAVVPLAAGEHLARCLPNARLAVMCAAGHAPFIRHEEEIARAIEAFVA